MVDQSIAHVTPMKKILAETNIRPSQPLMVNATKANAHNLYIVRPIIARP